MAEFVEIPITTNPEALQDDAFSYVSAKVDGWQLQPAHPMTWLIEAIGVMASEINFNASRMPAENLRTLGETVYNIPRNDGASAVAATTWVAIEPAGAGGIVIPQGTTILIDNIPFTTNAAYTIAEGETSTANGEVLVTAQEVGTIANGLGTTAEPVDALAWIDTITVEGTTSGGEDTETPEDYVNRLSLLLQLQAPRAITVRDFEVFTSQFEGVDRVAVLDTYNADHNVLTENQSSIETDTTGWGTQSATIARVTTQAADGNASLELTPTGATPAAHTGGGASSTITGLTPGTQYTATAEMRAATVGRSCHLSMWWYDAANGSISITTGPANSDDTTSWRPLYMTATAPPNAVKVALYVFPTSAAIGEVHYIDKIAFREGNSTTWSVGGTPALAERTVTIIPVDADGQPVNDAIKEAIVEDLEARREVNFVIKVVSPAYNDITVEYAVKAYAGFDTAALKDSVDAAITAYLSPADWGLPIYSEAREWVNTTSIRYLQLARIIEQVEGVEYITTLLLNNAASDVAMVGTGPMPLVPADATETGNLTSGSATVSSITVADIRVGQSVSGTGIAAGTTVAVVGGSTITLSANATASGTGVTLTFTSIDGSVV